MDLEFLFAPFERADEALTHAFEGAPLAGMLLLAVILGLRHASDPDHLVAVTSLVSARAGDVRAGLGLGAWWGVGHAATMLALGVPLIVAQEQLPAGLETAAERAIGIVIVALALRVVWQWWQRRGAARAGRPNEARHARGPAQAVVIGLLHGLAGTGAVVVLLIATMPTTAGALAALALFAPMSVVSMAACTGAYAWVLTRPAVDPVYRLVLMPALGLFGLLFGLWYAGL